MGLMKGKRAEREIIRLLQPIVERVYADLGYEDIPLLQRNTLQSHRGGYDIIGLEWLAIEVKHQEQLSVNTWWKQTLRQAAAGQMPTLFYRKNNVKWQVVIRTQVFVGNGFVPIRSTVSMEDYMIYFERRLRWEVSTEK